MEKETIDFKNLPLLWYYNSYRIPEPNLAKVMGSEMITPYITPLKPKNKKIKDLLDEYMGNKIDIKGTITGWLHGWYPTSVITGINVTSVKLSEPR